MPAARSPRRRESQLAFETLSIEGGLLSPEWLSRVCQLSAGAQSEADYRVPKGLNLRDEIGRYWRIAQANWREFDAGRSAGASKSALAEQFVTALLRDSFGFDTLTATAPILVADRMYPIGFSALGGRVPIVIAPAGVGVDTLASSFGDGGRRRSAFGVVQEFLNAFADATWGLVSDGLTLRVVRDNASLTRPAWIEADIERIFTEGRYADFAALWLFTHETRFGKPGQTAAEGALEAWRIAGREEGTRAREHLRRGVEEAVVALGQGFLSHPDNMSLRMALQDGSLTKMAYFQQLLRLVYRIIFLLTVEERGLLHPNESSEVARRLYAGGYGLKRLRDRSVKRSAHDRFSDLWEALKIVFHGVANGEPRLALPALGGLFATTQCPSLDACKIENQALLLAIFRLSWLREASGLSRVNWRDMGPEELGSVYEGLLELQPQITQGARSFGFATGGEAKGHARKTSGSYYTPDSLVQVLLDSALQPVVQSTIAANPEKAVEALLELAIVDPACGSGHFLLAAARRLAAQVARLQAGGTPSASEYRHALRQVVGRCIYGVDLNPMAVELCKVSLWMEAVEPGLPLTFLNSHIQHGNALLGATPELIEKGIPDGAWDPIEGDDKKIATILKKRNKLAATGQRGLSSIWSEPGANESAAIARAVKELESASDADAGALTHKESQWVGILESEAYRHQLFVANAWCAAFVWPKQPGPLADAAPTNELWRQLRDGEGRPPSLTVKKVEELAEQYHFFHWYIGFPQVFAKGGFDVVLGNPPWERLKLEEQEWFATRDPAIANAKNAASRRAMIDTLRSEGSELFLDFERGSRAAEAEPAFLRNSGAFPLCGRGRDINTAAVFLELMHRQLSRRGMLGCLTPASSILGDTTKEFVWEVVESRRLRRLFHFENEETIFPGVHHAFRFCLTVIAGPGLPADVAELVFYSRTVTDLQDKTRIVSLTAADVKLLSPITKTLPTVRTVRDSQIALAIYSRIPVLGGDTKVGQGWEIGTRPGHYHMSNDAELFRPRVDPGDTASVVPLYESKMVWLFDHRFGTYEGQSVAQSNQGKLPETTDAWHSDPYRAVQARYYVALDSLELKTAGVWSKPWHLVVREITSGTSERTVIAAILPRVATGHTLMLAASTRADAAGHLLLLASLNSCVLDYLARQKVTGTHLIPSVFRQLPVLPLDSFSRRCAFSQSETITDWLVRRAIELTYTAWDLEPFAQDVGYQGPPFRWDAARRFVIRAELDAAFFHLYGLSRDDTSHVLDAFPVLRKNDEKAHGSYRTKDAILEIYDRMAEAVSSGRPYATLLNPAPADPQLGHAPRAVAFDIQKMPALVPVLSPDEETAITIWAILRASGGTITRIDLARSFALRSQPATLNNLARPPLAEIAQAWTDKVGSRTIASGQLSKVLKTLAERDGVKLTVDSLSHSVVTASTGTPPENKIDPWFQFEARLALGVLAALPPPEVQTVDAGMTGDDRRLLEAGVA
jgi:hypothetical protein